MLRCDAMLLYIVGYLFFLIGFLSAQKGGGGVEKIADPQN